MNDSCIAKYNKILLIMEFGSKARGDDDRNSDHDIFVLSQDLSRERLIVLKLRIAKLLGVNKASISLYTSTHFRKTLDSGRLFAWHLKLEGKVLFTRIDIDKLFVNLNPYNWYKEDLTIYYKLLEDCKHSINVNGVNSFDLAMLFTICRNTCMVICYREKSPSFGRMSVFYKARELSGSNFLLLEEDYLRLSQWKLYYERGMEKPIVYPQLSQINSSISRIEKLLKISMGEIINGR